MMKFALLKSEHFISRVLFFATWAECCEFTSECYEKLKRTKKLLYNTIYDDYR